MAVTGVHGYFITNTHRTEPKFIISGVVIQKDRRKFDAIISKVKEIISNDSIYKGKAVRIDMSFIRRGRFDMIVAPQF